jgi:hypothetical protein
VAPRTPWTFLTALTLCLTAAPALGPAAAGESVSQATAGVPLAAAAGSIAAGPDASSRQFPHRAQLRGYPKALRWSRLPKVRHIRWRESRNTYRINTGNGYYGAYQFAYATWTAMGGQRYAPTADRAPKYIQDYVAWRLYRRAGWSPWGG